MGPAMGPMCMMDGSNFGEDCGDMVIGDRSVNNPFDVYECTFNGGR